MFKCKVWFGIGNKGLTKVMDLPIPPHPTMLINLAGTAHIGTQIVVNQCEFTEGEDLIEVTCSLTSKLREVEQEELDILLKNGWEE